MTIEEIQAAIERLSPEGYARFRAWFEEFDADEWDRQIERDIKAGKLDKLAEESLKDFSEGRCREI